MPLEALCDNDKISGQEFGRLTITQHNQASWLGLKNWDRKLIKGLYDQSINNCARLSSQELSFIITIKDLSANL